MKIYTTILILFFLISHAASGQWTLLNSDSQEHLRGVHFFNSETGIATGFNGTILKSNDGGVSWNEILYDSEEVLWDVHFVNNSIGWIIGASGTLLFTEDQGETWVQQDVESDKFLWGISFVNENEGWVVGNGAKIFYTNDRGETWIDKSIDNWLSSIIDVQFITDSIGYFISAGHVAKTVDKGNNWEFHDVSFYTLSRLYFIDEMTGWTCGENGTIYKTFDGGENWIRQFLGTIEWIQDIHFIDKNFGWAVGRNGKIFSTTNSGEDWKAIVSPTQNNVMNVYFSNHNEGWAVGSNGTILKYDPSTSVADLYISDEIQVNIYPNPSSDFAIIDFAEIQSSIDIKVFNISGIKVSENHIHQIQKGKYRFDRKNLLAGAYILKIKCEGRVVAKMITLSND